MTSTASLQITEPNPVGSVMAKYLARKFGIATVEFYCFRQLDAQREQPPLH